MKISCLLPVLLVVLVCAWIRGSDSVRCYKCESQEGECASGSCEGAWCIAYVIESKAQQQSGASAARSSIRKDCQPTNPSGAPGDGCAKDALPDGDSYRCGCNGADYCNDEGNLVRMRNMWANQSPPAGGATGGNQFPPPSSTTNGTSSSSSFPGQGGAGAAAGPSSLFPGGSSLADPSTQQAAGAPSVPGGGGGSDPRLSSPSQAGNPQLSPGQSGLPGQSGASPQFPPPNQTGASPQFPQPNPSGNPQVPPNQSGSPAQGGNLTPGGGQSGSGGSPQIPAGQSGSNPQNGLPQTPLTQNGNPQSSLTQGGGGGGPPQQPVPSQGVSPQFPSGPSAGSNQFPPSQGGLGGSASSSTTASSLSSSAPSNTSSPPGQLSSTPRPGGAGSGVSCACNEPDCSGGSCTGAMCYQITIPATALPTQAAAGARADLQRLGCTDDANVLRGGRKVEHQVKDYKFKMNGQDLVAPTAMAHYCRDADYCNGAGRISLSAFASLILVIVLALLR